MPCLLGMVTWLLRSDYCRSTSESRRSKGCRNPLAAGTVFSADQAAVWWCSIVVQVFGNEADEKNFCITATEMEIKGLQKLCLLSPAQFEVCFVKNESHENIAMTSMSAAILRLAVCIKGHHEQSQHEWQKCQVHHEPTFF